MNNIYFRFNGVEYSDPERIPFREEVLIKSTKIAMVKGFKELVIKKISGIPGINAGKIIIPVEEKEKVADLKSLNADGYSKEVEQMIKDAWK